MIPFVRRLLPMGETRPVASRENAPPEVNSTGALFTDSEIVRPPDGLALDSLREDTALTLRINHADRRRLRARAGASRVRAGPLRRDQRPRASIVTDPAPRVFSTNVDRLSF